MLIQQLKKYFEISLNNYKIIHLNYFKSNKYFEIIDINPAMLSNTFKIVVLKGETTVVEIEYSPFTYINSMRQKGSTSPELQSVLTAMYRYNEAAKAYVEN